MPKEDTARCPPFFSAANGNPWANPMKDIKPGVTLNVQEAFVLSDTSSVEFEASEFISFSDDVVSFTYSLS